jgi:hypothetical protein
MSVHGHGGTWLNGFGPEYTKINTVWERDERGVIRLESYSTPEIAYLADKRWYWYEKVDGTNIRLHWNGKVVTVGGREDNAQLPSRLVANMGQQGHYAPELWRDVFPDCTDATVYGEGYGAGIRSGGNYGQHQWFIVFDVNVGGWWLTQSNVEDVAVKLGFDVVPFVGDHSISDAWKGLRDGIISSAWPDCPIEGLVGRPGVDLYTRKGERIITKMKVSDHRDWLKNKERLAKLAKDAERTD